MIIEKKKERKIERMKEYERDENKERKKVSER